MTEWERNQLHIFPLITLTIIQLAGYRGLATASAERAAIELGEALAVAAGERIFLRRCPSDEAIHTYKKRTTDSTLLDIRVAKKSILRAPGFWAATGYE